MTNYVLYDTNALINLQFSHFSTIQAHHFFSTCSYQKVIPRCVLNEFKYISSFSDNYKRSTPIQRPDISLLLEDSELVKDSKLFNDEIQRIEKSVTSYGKLRNFYSRKEKLDFADTCLASITHELLRKSDTDKVALITNDKKLSEVSLEINREFSEQFILVNSYFPNWDDTISFSTQAPYVFSKSVIEKILSRKRSDYEFLVVHPNGLQANRKKFHYCYDITSRIPSKNKSGKYVRVVPHKSNLIERFSYYYETLSQGHNILEISPEGKFSFSFFKEGENMISKMHQILRRKSRNVKGRKTNSDLNDAINSAMVSSDVYILDDLEAQALRVAPKSKK